LRAAEKSQGAAVKNKGNVEANCTGFSVSKNVYFDNSRSLTRIHQRLLKSLGLYYSLYQIFRPSYGPLSAFPVNRPNGNHARKIAVYGQSGNKMQT
jgi:hypothetical protein